MKASQKIIEGKTPRASGPNEGTTAGPGEDREAPFSASHFSLVGMALVLCFVSAAALAAPPASDTCPGASVISDGPYPVKSSIITNIGQATSDGDPTGTTGTCASSVWDHGVWFKWTPTVSAVYELKLCNPPTATGDPAGGKVDTLMASFLSANGCDGPFNETACDDDTCCGSLCGGQSTLQSSYIGGNTYYIVVAHYTGSPGALDKAQIQISQVTAPVNDTCEGATSLTLDTPVVGSSNLLAMDDYHVPGGCYHSEGQIGNVNSMGIGEDLAYSFTAPSEGNYSFRVAGFLGGPDPILYVAGQCETPSGGQTPPINLQSCLYAANRSTTTTFGSEEVNCFHLTAGQTVFPIVDENRTADCGHTPPAPCPTPPNCPVPAGPTLCPVTTFTIEATRCNGEVEYNGAPESASALACPVEGAIQVAQGLPDFDFFALGAPAAGSRVFAIADGMAGNPSQASVDVDMRVTTATDTLEFNDRHNALRFGELSPNMAGVPLTGDPAFIEITTGNPSASMEPYRLYSAVRPPGTGPIGTSAHAELPEPNDDALMFGDYFYGRSNAHTTGFCSECASDGECPAGQTCGFDRVCSGSTGTPCASNADCPFLVTCNLADADAFGFCARVGDIIMTNVDADPLRDQTGYRAGLALNDPNRAQLYFVTDSVTFTSSAPGTGDLESRTPFGPSQAIVHQRATVAGLYTAVVTAQPSSARPPDDYLWQVSINCQPLAADVRATSSDAPDPAVVNGLVTYTITATNNGPNPATNAVMQTSVPQGTSFANLSIPSGWTCTTPPIGGTGAITCVSDVTGCFDGSGSFMLTVRVASCAGSSISNTATVSSVTSDPVPGNNSATQSTAVLGASNCDDSNSCTQDACDGASSSCTHTTILPSEVSHLRLGANKTSLAWDSQGPGATYDVARGVAGQWPVGSGGSETCVASQITTASTSDGAFPAAGSAFWYLARGRTTCGAGGYGTASSGTPRMTSACP